MPLLVSQPLDSAGAVASPGAFSRGKHFSPGAGAIPYNSWQTLGPDLPPWVPSSLEAQPAAALVLPGNVGFEDAL